ncbi:MAG TPA: CIA30 family protein [Candidatus Angelobacter sp.]|jgi:imidazolonepropionase-like amidohydrolase|nr:CIA30 family protein [Candidatus Angelobacter sp.]
MRIKACIFFFVILVSSSFSQPSAKPVFFEHVKIFDGHRFAGPMNVLVQSGKIQLVGSLVKKPAGAEVIAGDGLTLLPGLIDSHVHVFGSAHLTQALAFGVTTELDMFSSVQNSKSIEEDQAAGKLTDEADLRTAGILVTAPGGHGTEYGINIPTISSPDQAQAFVDARIAEGSDYIKIIYDDGLEYGVSKPIPTLDKKTLAAVIAAAHQRGKLAVVHIGSLQQAQDVINAGADGLAHLFVGEHSDPDLGKLAAAHHVFVVPTLSVLNSICGIKKDELVNDPRISSGLPSSDLENLKAVFPSRTHLSCTGATEAIHQLHQAHVPILAGTDAPNPGTEHGASMHGELTLLVQAGLSPTEALEAATANPAKSFRLNDRGEIAPGKRADLLLVKGDPGADITVTRNVVGVWKAGIRFDRDAYLAEVKKIQQEASGPPEGSESGVVSDFDDLTAKAKYGEWLISTDQIMGGKSTAKIEAVPGGANNSKGALHVTGEVAPSFQIAWSGAMFSPGRRIMDAVDLSSKKNISFWVKGDGKTYRIMLFTKKSGPIPLIQTFSAGSEWKQFTFPISSFEGADGHSISALIFAAGPAPGSFEFYLDEVHIE